MPTTKQIIDGIIARIQVALPDYAASNFQLTNDKNRNSQRRNRFAVRPLGLDSAEGALGTVGRLDLIQRFEVELSNSYTGNLSNDSEIVDKTSELLDDAIKAYNAIAPNKIALGGVKNVNTLSIEDPAYDEASKEIVLPFTFNIYYFRSI